MKEFLANLGLLKLNYKNQLIPTGAGFLFLLAGISGWLFMYLLKLGELQILSELAFISMMVVAVGLIDDMVGSKEAQGFRGHFRQLQKGQLTTGALKAIIVLLTVLLVVKFENSLINYVLNLGLILLATNFFNLLDLRPGRALKTFLLLTFITPGFFLYFFPIYLLSLIYLPYELKGQVMLGDAGANFLGVILGYALYLSAGPGLKTLLFLLFLFLNLLAERYSFNEFIKKNRYLRWFDQLGREGFEGNGET